MSDAPDRNRRGFLNTAAALGAGIIVPGFASSRCAGASMPSDGDAGRQQEGVEAVFPAEDLMRDHGIAKRVLLIYREGIRLLEAGEDLSPDAIGGGAAIIRSFIEEYHERLEEDLLFPLFRKANTLVDLVETLTTQHQAGRRVTDETTRLAKLSSMKEPDDRETLIASLQAFIRMYEPHVAHEDSVLFPMLRRITAPQDYSSLGEEFEKRELQILGADGLERIFDRLERIEKELGIYELRQFTPRT
jgi:hemerythrin-like domain-containing protein